MIYFIPVIPLRKLFISQDPEGNKSVMSRVVFESEFKEGVEDAWNHINDVINYTSDTDKYLNYYLTFLKGEDKLDQKGNLMINYTEIKKYSLESIQQGMLNKYKVKFGLKTDAGIEEFVIREDKQIYFACEFHNKGAMHNQNGYVDKIYCVKQLVFGIQITLESHSTK
jgi:hypothetical protein